MNWKFWQKKEQPEPVEETVIETQNSEFIGNGKIGYNPILYDIFDGEKNPGELGAVYDTLPDHVRLRLRAYDMNLKTDIIRIITNKFFKWVVGTGLKLQSEVNETVLEMCGVSEDIPRLKKQSEALFNLYASSTYSDYQNKDSLHEKAVEAFEASFLGGDCLCVLRVNKFGTNMQVVDGQHVESPLDERGKGAGNTIKSGIELNKKGEHVAFWVRTDPEDTGNIVHKRIKSRNSNGNLVAWMVYGSKARIDHHRGIPVISSILEKVSKLDRFVEASVKKAEETANVVYAFKHNLNSTGENILKESLTSKKNTGDGTSEDIYERNGKIALAFRQSVNGQVLNLTPDSDLVALSTENETTFNEFFRAVFVGLCAAVDIPEEVALQKYEQNYSSSRAAINGWEHIIEIYRERFAKKFYKPFYRLWLEHFILKDKIQSQSYLTSRINNDYLAMEAYYNCKFTGKKMPHIDPLKEAKAIREMLGDKTTPLMSREQAAESLGVGDYNENIKKFSAEEDALPQTIKDKQNAQNENNGQQSGVEQQPAN